MENEMKERIRYAWGHSSLGDFIVAASDNGLVAFEFADRTEHAVEALRARFPEASVELDDSGLADMLVKLADVVDRPDHDPGIPLDIRGTDYQKKVWTILRDIPTGTTTNYGAIATKMGTRDPRDVTEAIASNTIAILIPCHRVVKKDGSLSGYRWGFKRKRELLSREQRAGTFNLA
jgi:AraC family transcriptional regulator of adaptative response/methylated-DNA-[protein]-cysteine methyltransferase